MVLVKASKVDQSLYERQRADREKLGVEGVAQEMISAFDGPQHDEIKMRKER